MIPKEKAICFHGLGLMTQAIDSRICKDIDRYYCSSRQHLNQLPIIEDYQGIHISGVNSSGIDWLISSLKQFNPSECWLLTKGLHITDESVMTLPEYLSSELPSWKFSMIAGPALASDVLDPLVPFALMLASNDSDFNIKNYFNTTSLSFQTSADIRGVCFLAALKNIYAMMLGLASSYSLSTLAMCYQKACVELEDWMVLVDARRETVLTLAGVGDLFATALGGRNAKFGKLLTEYDAPDDILSGPMNNVTVEGYTLLMSFQESELFKSWNLMYPNSTLSRFHHALSNHRKISIDYLLSDVS